MKVYQHAIHCEESTIGNKKLYPFKIEKTKELLYNISCEVFICDIFRKKQQPVLKEKSRKLPSNGCNCLRIVSKI